MSKRGAHAWFQKIHWSEAEKIAGHRLDRRKQYYTHTAEGREVVNSYAFNGTDGMPDAKLLTYGEWTHGCSGCTCDCESGCSSHSQRQGQGCSDCGYTGKRRDGLHAPYEHKAESAQLEGIWEAG